MTNEASKTRSIRGHDFETNYLQGKVIDIGCGPDLVVPHAEPFDIQHGDAQEIAGIRPAESYDAVCSSHCLEHMRDVPMALQQWWRLVRPGGYLIIVVPDEDLYEQGGWPSLFNADHKATFRMNKTTSWSPVSFDIVELVQNLAGAQITSVERHDLGYDHSLRRSSISRAGRLLYDLRPKVINRLNRLGRLGEILKRGAETMFLLAGTPIDQTTSTALAQIQVIARKLP